jgi:prepilin-type N-terminal cleavage/methylation domain-containing protein
MLRHRRKRCRTCASGFTLVEVLIAFVIAAIGLQLAFELFSTHTRLLDDGIHESRAVALAEATLARIGTETTLQAGTSAGRFDREYSWRLVVVRLPNRSSDSHPIVVPYDITLTLSWPGWLSERSLQLHTLKLAPPPATQ